MTINIKCLNCNKNVVIFASRLGITKYCSKFCYVSKQKKAVFARERCCGVCGDKFIPRKWQIDTGAGKYCSIKCRNAVSIIYLHTPEIREKAYETAKKNGFIASHKMQLYQNTIRMREERKFSPEKLRINTNKLLKKYRDANPHKVREWTQTRNKLKVGRLPRGTIGSIHILQKGMCPICRKRLPGNYHTDHIMPIAKGGGHKPENIQLLCPSCNVRKSAKEPIQFMQEKGFLL